MILLQDEALLKKMLEKNPELAFEGASAGGSADEKVKIVFMNHGIPPLNQDLVNDIVKLIEEAKK